MIKLYIQNLGQYGSVIVIAENEESARKVMDDKAKIAPYCSVYDANKPVDEYPVTDAFHLELPGYF